MIAYMIRRGDQYYAGRCNIWGKTGVPGKIYHSVGHAKSALRGMQGDQGISLTNGLPDLLKHSNIEIVAFDLVENKAKNIHVGLEPHPRHQDKYVYTFNDKKEDKS